MPQTCIYSDGNGNSFVLKNSPEYTFEYRSISPKESSSGVYSGGKPVNKSLDAEDFEQVKGLMQELLADTSIRVKTRMMGTGFIKIETGEENVFEYVDPKKKPVQKLETMLKGIRD